MHNLSFDIASLHAAYAAGTNPVEVIRDVYHRLEAADDPGIFIHLATQEQALSEVAALGPFDPLSKPLWGIPFAVKDNIDVAGMPTTAACPAYSYEATADAVVVAALRRAGAIPLGKTNLDQFATGLVGVRSPYPIPKNAVDPALVPGGSSSGSAVAVARGLVSFAL
ncbi:MAG: allophanate hydrolase, partial [Candidatus Competibacteraceae bacterium]|nr:allophanate hydrolase [Candidatus Competibacteraceae bacterium]